MNRLAPTLICTLFALGALTPSFGQEARPYAPVQDGFTTTAATPPPYAPDRVLVQFTPEAMTRLSIHDAQDKSAGGPVARTGLVSLDAELATLEVVRISARHAGLKNRALARRVGADRWYRIDVAPGTDIAAAVARLAADPDVAHAEPDWRAFFTATPADPLFPNNWGHDNTAQLPAYDWGGTWDHTGPPVGTVGFDAKAKSAWNGTQGYGSSSVVIAILDSGVDATHPDILQVAGYDFGDGDTDPDDDSSDPGHGTACAGVAAGVADNGIGVAGIAGGCSIMPLKVSDNAGSIYFTAIQSALYHAADNGADVVSMSFGASISGDPSTDSALQYAYDAGVTLFAATGNANASSIEYPAKSTYVIAVGAASPCGDRKRSSSNPSELNPGVNTDPNGYTCDGERWWGSSYGSVNQDSRFAVDVLAPTILPTTDIQGSGGYGPGDYTTYFFNGTSCATPYAAGVAALIKSANPTWNPAQIRAQLTSTALDVVNVESGAGWDRYSGYGLVDAAAALGTPVVLPPTAQFEGTPTEGCAPLSVDFTDLSTGDVTSWYWLFGDGVSSSLQNPTHVYADPGVYDVRLTATGPEGNDTRLVNGFITVGSAVTAGFGSGTPSGPAPLSVGFVDTSVNGISRLWDFGDGATDTEPYPIHEYTDPGTYTVTLIATGDCDSDTLVSVDYVTVTSSSPPVAAFSGDPLTGCAPLEVSFTDETTGDVTSWDWDFGDGEASTDQNPVHIFAASGAFDVRLIAGGPGGVDTLTALAYVDVAEPVLAAFDVSDTAGTAPLEVTFTDSSTGSPDAWTWDFGDGGNDSAQNPVHTYTVPGLYTVTLVASSSACGADTLVMTDRIEVAAPPAPVAGFSADPVDGCASLDVTFTDASAGDIDTWGWDFGDGGVDSVQNPVHTYPTAGTYTVALTVTGPGGSDTLTLTDHVTVFDPVLAAFSQSEETGLAPFTVDFTDESTNGASSWLWDFGDGDTDTVPDPSHTFATQDSFTVTLFVGNGCSVDTLVVPDAVKVVGISGTQDPVPVSYRLGQNVPNPFNPMTTIWYELPERRAVRLQVYDVSGRLVRNLVRGEVRGPGRHEVVWNGRTEAGFQASAGVYFYHLEAGDFSRTMRMTLLK